MRKLTAHKTYQIIKPDILAVLQHEGVVLLQRGNTFWSCCPLHDEKTPSFKVDPDRQTFHCFGCNRHGDVFTFIMERRGLDFKRARQYLGFKSDRPTQTRIAENKERKELLAGFRVWETEFSNLLAEALRLYRRKEAEGFTYREALAFADVMQDIPYIAWLYEEVFCKSDDEVKLQIFKEEHKI